MFRMRFLGFITLIFTLMSGHCLASSSTRKAHSMIKASSKKKGHISGNKLQEKSKRKKLNEKDQKSVISVLEENEVMHQSFFSYNGKKVELAAKDLKKKIEGISHAEISKLLKFSKGLLSKIDAKSGRDLNNQNYHLVSMALIHIMNTYDVGDKYNAYTCPMVKKKWIQNSKKMSKIHNPYAPNMPHCGNMVKSKW